MDFRQAKALADKIVEDANLGAQVSEYKKDFRKYAQLVSAIIKETWTKRRRDESPWLKDFAKTWHQMYHENEKILASDPMAFYNPQHNVSKLFHMSPAFIRYFRAGNRTSKTQSGYAEHYFTVTGQHRWKAIPPPPHDTFIIGLNFSQYANAVFERKFITGEQDNQLSPMFPVNGKWLYKYDEKKHVLIIACPECAAAGRAQTCKHRKSRIKLYSDEGGWEVLQGASAFLGHFDEHVSEDFFTEALQRVQAAAGGSLIVTGTPLHGMESWETRRLAAVALGDPAQNRIDPEDSSSTPFVSLHEIDQFSAGIVSPDRIRLSMRTMDEFEIESRIYGRPAPLARNPVFDRKRLADLRTRCRPPLRYDLTLAPGVDLELVELPSHLLAQPSPTGCLRIWEEPAEGVQYIAGVDTAAGLAERVKGRVGDASCASILAVENVGSKLRLRMVAQYHGWTNPFEYAEEIFKLCVYYNSALCIVELTGGLGRAVVLKLKELAYWNIFRDSMAPELANVGLGARLGIDTNVLTKPAMVGALQQFIREGALDILCSDTIQELVAFEQERTDSGLSTRYRGAGGSPDDRVMSLAIATYTAVTYPIFRYSLDITDIARNVPRTYNDDWNRLHSEIKEAGEINPFA